MTIESILNNWDPQNQTVEVRSRLNGVIATISSLVDLHGVDKEKAAALGKVICQKTLRATDKKVLDLINTHIFGSSLKSEKRAKLINIQKEFYKGASGTPKLSLKWEADQWLKIQSKWLTYLSKIEGLQGREIALLSLIDDPGIFPYACQLNVDFPTLRLELILAVEAVKTPQRDALIELCQILCETSSWDARSKLLNAVRQQDPVMLAILNGIEALKRNKQSNHLKKIRTFMPMCTEQLQGLLAIPVDRFDATLKQAQPYMQDKQDYQKTQILIAFGSLTNLSPEEREEVVALAEQFTHIPYSYFLPKCIEILARTPREHRKRLLTVYEQLQENGYSFLHMKQFLSELPIEDWLKIEDRWIDYMRSETSSADKVEILKHFLKSETLLPFAEKLASLPNKRETIEALQRCSSDEERDHLIEIVSLLNLIQNPYYYTDWLNCLENTGISYRELLVHIRTYLPQAPYLDTYLNIFKGFIKGEPDYFKLACALIKGLNRLEANYLSGQFIFYKDFKLYLLAISLIREEMTYNERREILLTLTICSREEGQKLVDHVKRFGIKKKIGKALSVLEKMPKGIDLIPGLTLLDTTDEVKVALLEILSKKTMNYSDKATPLLLSLLSNTDELDTIASNFEADFETLQLYSELLKNVSPPSLKMAFLNLILNQSNFKELVSLLSSLTEGFTDVDVEVIQKLHLYSSNDRLKVIRFVLEEANSKNSRIILLKVIHLFPWTHVSLIIDTCRELKISDIALFFDDLRTLLAINNNTPASLNILEELYPLMEGKSAESRLLLIQRKGYYHKLVDAHPLPQDPILRLFYNTTGNFEVLSEALLYAFNTHSSNTFNNLLKLNFAEKPDGKQKAIAIYQQSVFIKLKSRFPVKTTELSTLVFSTTKKIRRLLSLKSTRFLKESRPFMEGVQSGDEKLKILERMQEAKNILDTCFPKGLSGKAKFNLRKLLITTHLDAQLIEKLLHDARKDFIVVLLAESLAHENRDNKLLNELIDTFFNQLDLYLPLIFERPYLVQYLIRHHYYKMHEAIAHKSYPPHIQSLLIPFLKPSEIVELVLEEEILMRPLLSGERSWPNPAGAFEDLQRFQDKNLIFSEFGEEGFIQAIPFTTLALLAKKRPELLLPYLTYFGDLQLAATLPFLDPHKVAQQSMPLPKIIVITKRAPVSLKRLLVETIVPSQDPFQLQLIENFYKACQEGDPYPIPPHKLEELESCKKTLESKVDTSLPFDIPPRYQDCTTFEVMTDPIQLPQKGKYVDRTTFNRLRRDGYQIRNPIDNLYYAPTDYKDDSDLKKELRCIDKHTGQVMEKPLKVPPDYTLHIDASLLNVLEKRGDEIQNPFDLEFYPVDAFLPDPELEEWMNEF